MLLFFISLFNYLFLNRIYHIHFNIKFNTFTALGVVFKMPSLFYFLMENVIAFLVFLCFLS